MNHTRPEDVLPDNEGSIHARQYNLDLLKAIAIIFVQIWRFLPEQRQGILRRKSAAICWASYSAILL